MNCKQFFKRATAATMATVFVASNSTAIPMNKNRTFAASSSPKEYSSKTSNNGFKSVTYYGDWSIYDGAEDYFWPSELPAEQLSHVNIAFYDLDSNANLLATDSYAQYMAPMQPAPGPEGGNNEMSEWPSAYGDVNGGMVNGLLNLRNKYPNLRLGVSVGGWSKSRDFSLVCADPTLRAKAVKNIINYMDTMSLDFVDIDWEYPGFYRDGDLMDNSQDEGTPLAKIEDGKNFVAFLQELKAAQKELYAKTGRTYELSSALTSTPSNFMRGAAAYLPASLTSGWDIKVDPKKIPATAEQWNAALTEYVNGVFSSLDFANLMTYDLRGTWDRTSGHHTALYSHPASDFEGANAEAITTNNSVDDLVCFLLGKEKDAKGNTIGYWQPDDSAGSSFTLMPLKLASGVDSKKIIIGSSYYSYGWANVNDSSWKNTKNPGLFQTTSVGPVKNADGSASTGALNEGGITSGDGGTASGKWNYSHMFGGSTYNSNGQKTTIKGIPELYPGIQEYFDEEAQAPYLYDSATGAFFTYDNVQSIAAKAKYVKDNNLGGMITWMASADKATSTGKRDELTKTIAQGLWGGVAPDNFVGYENFGNITASGSGSSFTISNNNTLDKSAYPDVSLTFSTGVTLQSNANVHAFDSHLTVLAPKVYVTLKNGSNAAISYNGDALDTPTFENGGLAFGETASQGGYYGVATFQTGKSYSFNLSGVTWNDVEKVEIVSQVYNTKLNNNSLWKAESPRYVIYSANPIPVVTTTEETNLPTTATTAAPDTSPTTTADTFPTVPATTTATSGNPTGGGTADNSVQEALNADGRRVIGYYTDWDVVAGNPYTEKDIPWGKLTHINYSFGVLGKDNKLSLEGCDVNKIRALVAERDKQSPQTKLLISVGGATDSADLIKFMLAGESAWQTFADSCVDFLREYKFEGIDMDIEYPSALWVTDTEGDNSYNFTEKGQNSEAMQIYPKYCEFMKLLRKTIDTAANADNYKYLLTAAVSPSAWNLRGMGNSEFAWDLDFVNIMTYDFYGPWSSHSWHNSAIYGSATEPEMYNDTSESAYSHPYDPAMCISYAVEYWKSVLPAEKITVGAPYYLHMWTDSDGLGSSATGNDVESSVPMLWDLYNKIGKDGNEYIWDDTAKVPYVYNAGTKTFYTFEDEKATDEKIKYILDQNLGGYMVWELSGDFTKQTDGTYTRGQDLITRASTGLAAGNKLSAASRATADFKITSNSVCQTNSDTGAEQNVTDGVGYPPMTTFTITNNTGSNWAAGTSISFETSKYMAYLMNCKVQSDWSWVSGGFQMTQTDDGGGIWEPEAISNSVSGEIRTYNAKLDKAVPNGSSITFQLYTWGLFEAKNEVATYSKFTDDKTSAAMPANAPWASGVTSLRGALPFAVKNIKVNNQYSSSEFRAASTLPDTRPEETTPTETDAKTTTEITFPQQTTTTPSGSFKKGDLNLDGSVNTTDLTIMKRIVAKWADYSAVAYMEPGELNKDDSINTTDLTIHKRSVAKWGEYLDLDAYYNAIA